MNKELVIAGIVTISCFVVGPTSLAKASEPDMGSFIEKVLYDQVDRTIGIGEATAGRDADQNPETTFVAATTVSVADDACTEGSAHSTLQGGQDFRRLIKVLRSLPFKTKQEQINELLATLHTLNV